MSRHKGTAGAEVDDEQPKLALFLYNLYVLALVLILTFAGSEVDDEQPRPTAVGVPVNGE